MVRVGQDDGNNDEAGIHVLSKSHIRLIQQEMFYSLVRTRAERDKGTLRYTKRLSQ